MNDAIPPASSEAPLASSEGSAEPVLQVERRDYTALGPANRARAHSLRGFDPIYTDIVDYIVRCTHRIWDERNIGLIYSHYTHNAVLYGTLGTLHSREEVVRDTIQRIAESPERRGLAYQVIWNGDDVRGFYTSHLVTSVGRHTTAGPNGPPTGRIWYSRTIADCMVFENRIFREWVVRDSIAQLRFLGLDPDTVAKRMAAELAAKGMLAPALGDTGRMLGQEPPPERADVSIANSDAEAEVLGWLHAVWNGRMFGTLREIYAPNLLWHGPWMRDLYGPAAAINQAIALLAIIPDAGWTAHHICSVPCEEGGIKVAVRWTMEGHHTGWGALGAPTGKPLLVMGVSHLHIVDGRVVEEWMVYDELAMRIQSKLPGP